MRKQELPAFAAARIRQGTVIPAMPLALDSSRRWDRRRQRALVRYYAAAGAGGLAVGVHSTQFAIRDPMHGLFEPVLSEVSAMIDEAGASRPLVKIGGICGKRDQALAEARFLVEAGYHAGLLSLGALKDEPVEALVDHARAAAEIIPLVGFYLQPAAGGRVLPYEFWRAFAEISGVVAIKIAPFDRYRTIDVVRAVCESGRLGEIALYTGNDDNIVVDLLTEYRFMVGGEARKAHIVGGLLGQWCVWTKRAVELHAELRGIAQSGAPVPASLLSGAASLTDANAAVFDAANRFAGCIPGIHEVLRLQGLLEGVWCLDPAEVLSPGQAGEIARVRAAYPELTDDDFVRSHLEEWLS